MSEKNKEDSRTEDIAHAVTPMPEDTLPAARPLSPPLKKEEKALRTSDAPKTRRVGKEGPLQVGVDFDHS